MTIRRFAPVSAAYPNTLFDLSADGLLGVFGRRVGQVLARGLQHAGDVTLAADDGLEALVGRREVTADQVPAAGS